MSEGATRIERMRDALQALDPSRLEIVDEGHKHVGHEGARDGRGHFALDIVSEQFAGLAPLARHRRIYEALGTLMQSDIHALSIRARTTAEAR
jgi:BolA protein